MWTDRGATQPDDVRQAIADHRAIAEALSRRDADAAAAAMHAHMDTASHRVLALLEDRAAP
jgi:DNA-binding GntR family transcriptional regulator